MQAESNSAEFVGTIGEDVRVDYHYGSTIFYKVVLHVRRASGTIDEVPMIVRDSILQKCGACKDSKVSAKGTIRSHLKWDQKRHINHTKWYVFVTEMEVVLKDSLDRNDVFLSGTLCGSPVLRITSMSKRTIVDFSIISQLQNKKAFRIWCIAWGNDAHSINEKIEGDIVTFHGRFQSKNYIKRWDDGEEEQRITYEISVMNLIE